MLLVVFGAGASFDSVPSRPPGLGPHFNEEYRPPLANFLFDERSTFREALERFPACQTIVPYLRPASDGAPLNVERVLTELDEEASQYAERHRQLAAVRFYLRYGLRHCQQHWLTGAAGVTNYKTLLDQIRMHLPRYQRVCFVTFNYDTLLEHALNGIGRQFDTIDHYVVDPTLSVIKIHGSVDWWRRVRSQAPWQMNADPTSIANEVIARAHLLEISSEYVVDRADFVAGWPQEPPMYPAIAIPLERKRDFECPDTHIRVLQDALPHVRRILFIGWRANDVPFLDLIRPSLAGRQVDAYVVAAGNNETRDVVNRLKEAGVAIANFFLDGGFSEFVRRREVESFLRA